MNRQKKQAVALATALTGIFLFSTCQQFFTTSLASALARDAYTIPANISVADATTLLAAAIAEGDAIMAAALVSPLLTAATAAVADPTSDAYQAAATALLNAAVLSSGVGPAIADITTDFLAGGEDILATAIEAASTISLSADAAAGLRLISSAETIPDDLSVEDAYAAALALLVFGSAENDVQISATELPTEAQITLLDNDPSIEAARFLLQYASDNAEENSVFNLLPSGDLLAQLGL